MAQIEIDNTDRVALRPLLVRLVNRCMAAVGEMNARRNINRSLKHLSSEQLRDIALIQDDITTANSAPLSQDAATKLEIKARKRSTNW